MNDKHELDVEQHKDEYFFSHELIFQHTLIWLGSEVWISYEKDKRAFVINVKGFFSFGV